MACFVTTLNSLGKRIGQAMLLTSTILCITFARTISSSFLDYRELSGDMSQQDFAWHLFEKMQYLMSQQCKSALGMTLQMYIPHSDLLKQMHLHLSPAHAWSTPKADTASQFGALNSCL